MTKEKAAQICQSIKFILDKEDYSEEVEEALNMAIEALQQQRQEILPKHCIVPSGDYVATAGVPKLPKRGKWVDVSERGSWSIKNACDQCGEIVFQPNYNYCPNCGSYNGGEKHEV